MILHANELGDTNIRDALRRTYTIIFSMIIYHIFNDHKKYDSVRAQNSALQESWMVDYLLS